jgi:hypothetical protein
MDQQKIQLLQPKYASYLSSDQRAEIVRTIERAIDFLGSPEIGVDDRHGPRLYSRFLRGLFDHVKTPPAKNPRSRSRRKISGQAAPANPPPPQATISPSANHFEPLPAVQISTPFDHFAWPTEVDLSASVDHSSGLGLHGVHASEFFYAPLPFDSDLVESMQSLSSLHEMDDATATLPGKRAFVPLSRVFQSYRLCPFFRIRMDEANAPHGFWSVSTTNGHCVWLVTWLIDEHKCLVLPVLSVCISYEDY